jgi:hypothetical protein
MVVSNLPLHVDRIRRDFPNADVNAIPVPDWFANAGGAVASIPPGAAYLISSVHIAIHGERLHDSVSDSPHPDHRVAR